MYFYVLGVARKGVLAEPTDRLQCRETEWALVRPAHAKQLELAFKEAFSDEYALDINVYATFTTKGPTISPEEEIKQSLVKTEFNVPVARPELTPAAGIYYIDAATVQEARQLAAEQKFSGITHEYINATAKLERQSKQPLSVL